MLQFAAWITQGYRSINVVKQDQSGQNIVSEEYNFTKKGREKPNLYTQTQTN